MCIAFFARYIYSCGCSKTDTIDAHCPYHLMSFGQCKDLEPCVKEKHVWYSCNDCWADGPLELQVDPKAKYWVDGWGRAGKRLRDQTQGNPLMRETQQTPEGQGDGSEIVEVEFERGGRCVAVRQTVRPSQVQDPEEMKKNESIRRLRVTRKVRDDEVVEWEYDLDRRCVVGQESENTHHAQENRKKQQMEQPAALQQTTPT